MIPTIRNIIATTLLLITAIPAMLAGIIATSRYRRQIVRNCLEAFVGRLPRTTDRFDDMFAAAAANLRGHPSADAYDIVGTPPVSTSETSDLEITPAGLHHVFEPTESAVHPKFKRAK